MKNKSKADKKTITIDITEFYDEIRKMASEDIRTVDEEVKYLIKKGITNVSYINNYQGIQWTRTPHSTDDYSYLTTPCKDPDTTIWCTNVNDRSHENNMQPINENCQVQF